MLLKTISRHSIFMLTFMGSSLSFVGDPVFKRTLSNVDLLSIKIENTLHTFGNAGNNFNFNGKTCRDDGINFTRKGTVFPINIRESMQNAMKTNIQDDIFPQVCILLNHPSFHKERNSEQDLWNVLKNQIDCSLSKDFAGIDIWSLDDDDSQNACGKNPFPIVQHISDEMRGEKASFNSFTDLDIILSTGESQVKELQVLYEANATPEEMKKFKCERIGFFRHPTDCSKFYHCSEYRPTTANQMQYAVMVYKCPRGLVYDEVQSSCNWPSHTEPCQGSDELMPVAKKKFTCKTPGFHADLVDCRWFYYCSDLGDGLLAAFEFLCPSHLLGYDEERLLCNWKWLVPACTSSNASYSMNGEEHASPIPVGSVERAPDADVFIPNAVSSTTETGRRRFDVIERRVNNDTSNTSPEELDYPRPLRLPTENPKYLKDSNPTQPDTERKSSNAERNNRQSTQAVNYLTINNKGEGIPPLELNGHLKGDVSDSQILQGRNVPEKKLGTAYWHRSMVTGNRGQSKENVRRNNDTIQTDHRYGIGSVRKINPKEPSILIKSIPLDEDLRLNVRSDDHPKRHEDRIFNSYYDAPSQSQGRSVNGVGLPIEFQNKVEQASTRSPYASVKCSKSRARKHAREDESEESDLECVSEVSLVINLKPGRQFEKYILQTDKISNSAYQESKQVPFSSNETVPEQLKKITGNKSNGGDSTSVNKRDNTKSKTPESSHLESETEGSSESVGIYSSTQYYENGIVKSNPRAARLLGNFQDNESVVDRTAGKTKENVSGSFESINKDVTSTLPFPLKENMMPLKFYPQGVLINVNLDYMNEIPPQVLLEVDRMLKKFMNDGDIDVNLLMTKLNATSEKMRSEVNNSDATADSDKKIVKMISMLEKMLHSSPVEKPTELNIENKSTMPPAITEEYTTEEILYENVTMPDNAQDKENTEKSRNTNDSGSPLSENSPIIDVNSLKNTGDGENFGRRRLFRKPKFPSIREQLEIQKFRQSLSTSTEVITPPTAVPNRFRYPSLRSEINLDAKSESMYHSIPNDTPKMEPETTTDEGNNKDRIPERTPQLDDLEFSNPDEHQIPVRFKYPSIREQLNQHAKATPKRVTSNEGQPLHRGGYDSGFSSVHSQHFGDRVRDSGFNQYVSVNRPETPPRSYHTSSVRDPETPPHSYHTPSVRDPETLPRSYHTPSVRDPETHPRSYHTPSVRDPETPPRSYHTPSVRDPETPPRSYHTPSVRDPETLPRSYHTPSVRDPETNTNNHVRNQYSGSSSLSSSDKRQFHEKQFNSPSYDDASEPGKAKKEHGSNSPELSSSDGVQSDLSKFQYTFPLQPFFPFGNAPKFNSPTIQNPLLHTIGRSMDRQGSHLTRSNNVPSFARPEENISFDGTEKSFAVFNGATTLEGNPHSRLKNEDSRFNLHRDDIETSKRYDRPDSGRENYARSLSSHNIKDEGRFSEDRSRQPLTLPDQYRPRLPLNPKENLGRSGRKASNEKDSTGRERTSSNGRRRRKGRKLRILVKKNQETSRQNPDTNPPITSERIPENLLSEIRSKVLKKLSVNGQSEIELQIKYQDHVWNVPFVNSRNSLDISPEICTRAGLFQHPKDCNMFYECFWDKWLTKFTLHVFSCPVKLVYDENIRGCSRPSLESHCRSG